MGEGRLSLHEALGLASALLRETSFGAGLLRLRWPSHLSTSRVALHCQAPAISFRRFPGRSDATYEQVACFEQTSFEQAAAQSAVLLAEVGASNAAVLS